MIPSDAEIHSAYKSICLGYSEIKKPENLFVKHLDSLDLAEIGEYYGQILDHYISIGAKKQEDILEQKRQENLWSDEMESKIKSLENNILLMSNKRGRAYIESQLDEIDQIIADYQSELNELLNKKNSFFVNSAETYADSAITDFIIQKSFFVDKELVRPKFSLSDVEYLDKEEIAKYVKFYSISAGKIDLKMIKYVAINPKFYMFFEKSSSSESFFGRPGFKVTRNQILLFDYSKYFADIIGKTPDLSADERKDPDKIEKAFIVSQNQDSKPQGNDPRSNFAKAQNFKLN